MVPWEILGREKTPGGGEIVLARRGEEYSIRVDGWELMSSRQHGSEEALARLGCEDLKGVAAPHVLVGGLGLGYTLRATLDALPPAGKVTVSELLPAVVAWNRKHLQHLAGKPLDDPRVAVDARDVALVLRDAPDRFDAVLLDVDNGPTSLTFPGNDGLYDARGLATIRRSLRRNGVLAIWSAAPHPGFLGRLRAAGFAAGAQEERQREGAGGRKHTIFLGRVTK